jgi:hypothetical protein
VVECGPDPLQPTYDRTDTQPVSPSPVHRRGRLQLVELIFDSLTISKYIPHIFNLIALFNRGGDDDHYTDRFCSIITIWSWRILRIPTLVVGINSLNCKKR